MKFKLSLMVSLALTVVLLPAYAASPTTQAKKSAASNSYTNWPKWYYYDQLGLREWNKGDRPKAKSYFDQSFRYADNTVRGQTSLDPITKRRLKEMMKHQGFLISYFVPIPPQNLRNLSRKEVMARTSEKQIEDTQDKLRFIDKLISFSEGVFGRNNYETQDLTKQKSLYKMRVMQLKAQVESMRGWPVNSYDNGGKYTPNKPYTEVSDEKKTKGPKWYTGSTTDSWNKKNQGKPTRTYQEAKGTMYTGGRPVPRSQTQQLPRQGKIAEGDGPREWGQSPSDFNKQKSNNLWGQSQNKSDLDLNKKDKPLPWGQSSKPKTKQYNGWGNSGWSDPRFKPQGKVNDGTEEHRDNEKPSNSVEWK